VLKLDGVGCSMIFLKPKKQCRVLEFAAKGGGWYVPPPELTRRMEHQQGYVLMTTDATCIDERERQHLLEYIDGTLSAAQAMAFEEHLLECLACEADVSNWKNLAMAIKAFCPRKVRRRVAASA
jgi:hypothetical protein